MRYRSASNQADVSYPCTSSRHPRLTHFVPSCIGTQSFGARFQKWTLQLLLPWPVHTGGNVFHGIVRPERATPLPSSSLEGLRWYFEQGGPVSGSARPSDTRFRRAQRAFARPRFSALYRHWLADGDSVLELVSSTTIGDALTSRTAELRVDHCPRIVISHPWLTSVNLMRRKSRKATAARPYRAKRAQQLSLIPGCERLTIGSEVFW